MLILISVSWQHCVIVVDGCGACITCLFSGLLMCAFQLREDLMMLLFSQVWQCAAQSLNHKRFQFQLLAELEHDAGVSGEDICISFISNLLYSEELERVGICVWTPNSGSSNENVEVSCSLWYRLSSKGEHHRSESSRDSAGFWL